MNERTNERDIISQASSVQAPQEHLGAAHGIKPVVMQPGQGQIAAQPAVTVVKARVAAALRRGEELNAEEEAAAALINDAEAADAEPAPSPAPVPTEPVPAEPVPTTTSTTPTTPPPAPAVPAAAAAEGVAPAAAGGATSAATTTAAASTSASAAAATGGFFSTTAGIATMAGGGLVVVGAAAGGGGGGAAAPAPAPVSDTTKPAAPGVTLTTDSGASTTDTITNAAAISLSGVETAVGTKVEYKLDNAAAWSTTYTAPTTDGAHTLEVRQTDAAGNISATTTTLSFTLDAAAPAAPTLALANAVAGAVTNSAALAAITPEAGATVEYRVDGGAWGAYTAPLTQGAHTVDARQVDVAGNASAVSTVSFTLDTVAPAAPVVALANGATSLTNSAALTPVTPEAGATVEYRVDGGNWVPTYSAPVGDIAHTVDVRQTDAAGNASPLTTLSFTLDTAAPAVPVVALANGATSQTSSAALSPITPDVGATVEYRINNGAWGTYTPPATDGAYTVEARQVDAAGNISAASAPLSFTLDTLAPLPAALALVATPVNGVVTNSTINVTSVEPNATAQYRVYTTGTTASAWAPLTPDANGAYTVPSQAASGLYTVDVQVTDAAGNTSPLSTTSFDLQGTPGPVVTLVSDTGTNGDSVTSNSALNISASTTAGLTQVQYSADGTTLWTTAQPAWVEGLNITHLRYVDPTNATPPSLVTTLQFTLDTQVAAPTLGLQTGTTALTNSSALMLGGIEAGATVEYSADNITWGAQQPADVQGANTIYVHQIDVAGNISAASTALTFNLDSVAPTAPVVALTNGATTLTNNAGLSVTSEPGAVVEYNVNNSGWSATYTAPVGDIAHTVDVRQTDAAGNVSAPASITFTLDSVAPAAPVVALANGATTLTNDAALTAVTPEAGATVEYSLNGGAWSPTYTAPTALTNGTAYTVDVRQTDAVGNISAATALAFTLDNAAPAAPVVALANGATTLTNNAALAAVAATEVGATVQYSVDGSTTWGAYTAPTTEGAHTVGVREVDAAGNISASTTLAFTLDTLAPATPSLFKSGTQTAISGAVTNSAIDLSGVETGATVQYRVYTTGATPSAWTPLVAVGGVYTVPSQPSAGLYTVDVQVTDAAGNISALNSASFDLQGTAGPVATLVNDTGTPGDGVTFNSALNIPASTTPSLTQVEYSADGVTLWSATPPAWNEGLNTTHLRYTDPTNATPPSLVTTLQFTLDTVVPNVSSSSLVYTPSALAATQGTLIATVALGANAAVGDTLTLTVAGASAQPLAIALSAADVAAGSVSITIDQATLISGTPTSVSALITDLAGNGNNLPAVVSAPLNFDNAVVTPSGLALANGATTLTNSAVLAALTGVEGGALVEYSVDNGAWGTYSAPAVNGQHSVQVRQTDTAGNISAASAPLSFTLDTVTPDVGAVTLNYAPSALAATAGTVTATVALGANAAIGDTLTLTVVGASASPAPVVLSNADIQSGTVSFTIDQATLTSGTAYTASAQIADAAGNAAAAVVSTPLVFDNVVAAPTGLALALDSGTAGDNITHTATLAALVGVEAGATPEYSVDGITWTTLAPTAAEGSNTVYVRQIDAAGNISAASAPLTFTLDTIVATPAISLVADTGLADGITKNVALNAPTGVEAGATVEYSLNGGAWGAYTAPTVDGTFTVSVRQTDVASNISAASAPLTLTLDTAAAAPGVALLNDTGASAIDGITKNANLAALAGVEPGALVEYSMDGGLTWSPTYTPPTLDGTYSVSVRQTDVASNVSPTSTLAFTLDTTAPVALAVSVLNDSLDLSAFALPGLGADGITNDPTPQFAAETAGNLVEFSVDGATWVPDVMQVTHPGGVAVDGAYSFFVRETDAAGNVTTSATPTYSFMLDTVATAPTLTLDPLTSTVVGGVTYSRDGSFWDAATGLLPTASYTDAHPSTELYSLDVVGTWVDLATLQMDLAARAAGTGRPTTVWVQQTDAAGNISAPASVAFTLDNATLAPLVALATDTGALNDQVTSNPSFGVVATEANSTFAYSFTDPAIVPMWTPITAGATSFAATLPLFDINGQALPVDANGALLPLEFPTQFAMWVEQIDIAGNTASVQQVFSVDNFAAAPLVTNVNGGGTGTPVSDGTLVISGESVTARFEVSGDGGITWMDSNIYSPTSMAPGANSLQVRQIDDAGNVSAATPFVLNLQATMVSTLGIPGGDQGSAFIAMGLPSLVMTDTGAGATLNTDHITRSPNTIQIQPSFPNGNADLVEYQTLDPINGPGAWTPLMVGTVLPTAEGLNNFLVRESYMDGTGQHFTPVIPMSITVDTTPPAEAIGSLQVPQYELFTSASGAPAVAVMRVVFDEAITANTAMFDGQGNAGGQFTTQIVSSGLSLDSQVSLGVQPDHTTVVELRFTETVPGAFTQALIVPTATVFATDLAGNTGMVTFTTPAPPATNADWLVVAMP